MMMPTTTSRELERFTNCLIEFRHRYRSEASDVVRFESLLDDMFDVFVQASDGERCSTASTARRWKRLPSKDNLDTGNAQHLPYAPLVNALQASVRDTDAYRGYVGPRPIDGLSEGVLAWLARRGAFSREQATRLAVAVGVGTVNLYDALCRKLVVRPGDIVLFPPISYGFFVPQVSRAGGRVSLLSERAWWLDVERHIGDRIRELEAARLARWRPVLGERMRVYAREIAEQRGVRAEPFEAALQKTLPALRAITDPRVLESELGALATATLFEGDRSAFEDLQCQREFRLPAPPRVVAFFFTNPDTYGRIYTSGETELLARQLDRYDVALVEDWAYHSLGAPPEALGSVVAKAKEAYLLVGLSKPLAVADLRIGLMIANKAALKPVYRIIENSIGFVSTRTQLALKHVFDDLDGLDSFLGQLWNGSTSYEDLRDIAVACFGGCNCSHLDLDQSERCRMRLEAFARETYPQLPEEAVAHFAQHGLSRWFAIPEKPQAGFFLVVDCAPFLERPPRKLAGVVRGSFDVFAAIAMLYGVRSIPEECMGNLDFRAARHIRFTFSVSEAFLLDCALTLHLGLQQLDAE